MKDLITQISRRELLKFGSSSAAVGLTSGLAAIPGVAGAQSCVAGQSAIEDYAMSPLILSPWIDPLPIPVPLKPVPQLTYASWATPPQPFTGGLNDSDGVLHQLGPERITYRGSPMPAPIVYHVKLQVAGHSFTSSKVLPISKSGQPVDGRTPGYGFLPTTIPSTGLPLPQSTIYGFNGKFPGPMINAEYGKPVLVRFENRLHENPSNLDRQNFGSPDLAFLTHLHNAHTAPESDGNPLHKPGAHQPGQWVDNMYLNWPPGNTLDAGNESEKQSTFWFHDHRMDHTGANVYKGMVGLYPIYDTVGARDIGDERRGYRLPGNRSDVTYADGTSTFSVKYDVPVVLYDCRLEDGVTQHQDFHNGCGETHPEWWGKTFFRHFPNHGFVGDVFTANGKAFPVLEVKRRRYRLRFLDASVARIYNLKLMNGNNGWTPRAFPGQAGQYNLGKTDSSGQFVRGGQQCMKFVQVASEGGLLPFPILRDSIELWPAKRREVIIDFTKFQDGTPTTKGDVIYLTNVMQMTNGRKPDDGMVHTDPDGQVDASPAADPSYAVPILKIVIGDDAPDFSEDPLEYANGTCQLKLDPVSRLPLMALRSLPAIPTNFRGVTQRTFELQRGGTFGGETQWLINGRHFDPLAPLAFPIKGSGELWTLRNGGGGWVHPMHMHMEEHRVLYRNGIAVPTSATIDYRQSYGTVGLADPGDHSKEDVVGLKPGEEVVFYRRFRTFNGPYVAHCHNLPHEDHAMMFGWKII